MLNPTQPLNTLTIGDVLGYVRDLVIMGTVLTIGWKSRGFWQEVTDFIRDIKDFMAFTRLKLTAIEENHLTHIEAYLKPKKSDEQADV